MALDSASPALPAFPQALIQLKGSGFGANRGPGGRGVIGKRRGRVTCSVLSSPSFDLRIHDWSDTVIFAEAPSVADIQSILPNAFLPSGAWARAMSIPLTVQVYPAGGKGPLNSGVNVCLFLGCPTVTFVQTIDARAGGSRSFYLEGTNFGSQDYCDVHFAAVSPPWNDTFEVSNGIYSFLTFADKPFGDNLLNIVRDGITCTLTANQEQQTVEFLQSRAILLNPFITQWTPRRIDFNLPASLDLQLLPGPNPGFGGIEVVDAYIVVSRNLASSTPAPCKVITTFVGL